MTVTFECKYEVDDYVHGYKVYAAKSSRRWITRFCWVMMAGTLILAILGSIGSKGSLLGALPLFVLCAFWFYYGSTIWKKAAQRAFNQRPELTQLFTVNVDDSAIGFSGPISQNRWTWTAFIKYAESKQLFLAYLSPCVFVVFPKRVLGPDQESQIRELLRQKLPAK